MASRFQKNEHRFSDFHKNNIEFCYFAKFESKSASFVGNFEDFRIFRKFSKLVSPRKLFSMKKCGVPGWKLSTNYVPNGN